GAYPSAAAEFFRPPGRFRYAGAVLLAILLLLADALPAQSRLEGSVLDGIAGSCPGRRVAIDPDLTRACRAFTAAVQGGRAPITGPSASFFASLESYEPSPVAGIATVSPASRADRAAGELYPKTCRFDRIGVAAAEMKDGGAVVCALSAVHRTTLARIPGRVEAGHIIDVSGTLGAGLSTPRLFVTRPSGDGEEIALEAAGDTFGAKLPLTGPGEPSMEVLANLLEPRHRRLGLGAASGLTTDGNEGVYLTEVFAVPAVAMADPIAAIVRVISAERKKRGLPPLRRDSALDGVALEEVRRTAASDQMKLDRDLAGRALSEVPDLSGAVAELYVGNGPDTVASSKNLADQKWKRIGVGAQYSSSQQYGPGRLWVLLLYGR